MDSIIIAVIGSSALSAVVSGVFGIIDRHLDNKAEDIDKKLSKLEKDSVRTQLLLLMSDYPQNQTEIMEVAQHYFADIGGNWYMTKMFNTWLTQNKIAEPKWFNTKDS